MKTSRRSFLKGLGVAGIGSLSPHTLGSKPSQDAQDALLSGALLNDLSTMKSAISKGANPNHFYRFATIGGVDQAYSVKDSYVTVSFGEFEFSTALQVVASEKKPDIVKFLVDHGALVDLTAEQSSKGTPLLMCRDDQTARVLLEAGADVNATKDDLNIFYFKKNFPKIISVVTEYGGDINQPTCYGLPALHLFSSWCTHPDEILSLLELGARVLAKDPKGYEISALDQAQDALLHAQSAWPDDVERAKKVIKLLQEWS